MSASRENGSVGKVQQRRSNRLLWLAVVLLGAGIVAYMIATHDLRQINGKLNRIARLVSKRPGEGPLTGLTRAREIMTCFSSNVVVDLGSPWQKVAEREELTAVIHHTRSSAESIDVTVRDRNTSVQRTNHTAVTVTTVEAAVGYRGSVDRDVRIFRIFWVKDRAGWVIERVEAADSIRPPPGLRAWES